MASNNNNNNNNNSSSSSSSSSNDADPRRRRKRWAPKVKTGCVTCQARRVKCDETKPLCKRCTVYGYVCHGYVSPADHVAAQQHNRPTRLGRCAEKLDGSLEMGLALPDADFMDSCRFYIEAVLPLRQRELDWEYLDSLDLRSRYRPGFLLSMTAQKISLIGVATNTLPHPTNMPSISSLWTKFFACMVMNIQDINKYLNSDTCWAQNGAPNSAFLALVRLDDDATKKLPASVNLAAAKQFHIVTAAVANSTSPASDQIEELGHFSMDEIASVYSKQLYGELPCPTALFVDIVLINKLRALVVSGIPYDSVILPAFVKMMARIDSFVPETWKEPYGVPQEAMFILLARIFKCSVALYAILTLAPLVTSLEPEAVEDWGMRRLGLREELVSCMREACRMLQSKSKAAMSWPVAVAAVAVAEDGGQQDQDFVASIFVAEERGLYDSFYVPMFYIDKLRKFWASGRRGWEDLFDEPFAPMA